MEISSADPYDEARLRELWEVGKASDEHGVLQLNGARGYALGDKLKLIPGHCDPTVNLHDRYFLLKGGSVIGDEKIDARGATW